MTWEVSGHSGGACGLGPIANGGSIKYIGKRGFVFGMFRSKWYCQFRAVRIQFGFVRGRSLEGRGTFGKVVCDGIETV